MTAAYCPIIPMKAARKIPACDYLRVGGRDRRFLFDLINLGVAAAAKIPIMPSYDQWDKLTVKNEKKLIPPLALVQVPQNSFIACADVQFNLYGTPVGTSNSSLVILQNDTLTRTDIDVFNIQKYINDSDGIKLRFINSGIDDIMHYVEQISSSDNSNIKIKTWHKVYYPTTLILAGTVAVIVVLIQVATTITFLFKFKVCRRKHHLTILKSISPSN
ncbi:unnamed protein product [Didymodactylos carnosus]|uniref:Uncharacterized protein n=1 Tax=Didymodactylos carnosus TaxID=1234261 RepID=A0A8S2XNX2_9BILA|nr:unnamed protein product [Didymodactylos carnosus]